MNYETQNWYDSTKDWTTNYTAFLKAQEDLEYTLGDFTGTVAGDMEMYTDLKIKSGQEKVKIADFNKAKDAAFAELSAKHDKERQDLGVVWQGYEDNDYTIPQ